MTEKGIRVWIDASTVESGLSFEVYPEQQGGFCYSKYNLLTDQQLAERDKEIARAAFERGRALNYVVREETRNPSGDKFSIYEEFVQKSSPETADDYLQSEEFKKLVGEM